MPKSVLAELSYAGGVRALDLQERAVEQLRSRTGTLLAASSLTASFLGAQTIQHTNGLEILGGLALVSLAASIGLCVYVLLPKKGVQVQPQRGFAHGFIAHRAGERRIANDLGAHLSAG
jgi:hypothetical protein